MATTRHSGAPGSAPDVMPPAALYSRICAALETTPAATTRTRKRVIAALAVIPVLTAAVVAIASQIVYEQQAVGLQVGAQSTSKLLLVLCLLVVLTLASTLLAVWRGGHGWGAGARSLILAAGLVAPIYAALVLLSPVHTPDAGIPSVEISPWGVRCFTIATIVGAGALASFAIALRRAVPVANRLRGAALGAAAGVWAGLAVFVFCPSGDPQHLLLGHVLPVVAFTLLGGFALVRALRP